MAGGYTTKKGITKAVMPTYVPQEIKEEFKARCIAEKCTPAEVLRRFVYIYLGKSQ